MNPSGARSWRLEELAAELGLECRGRGGVAISSARDLDRAGPHDLAAMYDRELLDAALRSRAGVLIVAPDVAGRFGDRPLLLSGAPKAAFARALQLIHPPATPSPGVHETAVVDAGAALGREVAIGPFATVGPGCRLGDRSVVEAGCVVLADVEIGEGVHLHPRVVIYPGTIVGDRAQIFAGAVVGAPGFGFAVDEAGRTVRMPHLGRVVIEPGAEVGANTTIDRATFGETRIGARSRLDNLVQIGHNAIVGEDSMIAAQSGMAGSSRLGRGVRIGGQSGVADHVAIGDGGAVAAKTAVFQDVPPGAAVAGIPAVTMRLWRRMVAAQTRLPDIWRAVRGSIRKTGEEE